MRHVKTPVLGLYSSRCRNCCAVRVDLSDMDCLFLLLLVCAGQGKGIDHARGLLSI